MESVIHQKIVVGQYSMIGANSTITKHVFPYYININNKLHRLNEKKIPKDVKKYDNILKELNNSYLLKNYDSSKYNLSQEITEDLLKYINHIIYL